ncbi:MAG: hypothetical protein K2X47_12700 [Bdellovibrionales bacterium]|nr:hypothetical protein [Bdellovibrionales bacterium]
MNFHFVARALFTLLTLSISAEAAALELLFQWRPVEGADKYVIEISEEADFQEPLVIERASKTEYLWQTDKVQKVYWRVAADGKRKGLFSAPQLLDIADLLKNPNAYSGVVLTQAMTPEAPSGAVEALQPQDSLRIASEPVAPADPQLDAEVAIPFQVNLHLGGGGHSLKLLGTDMEAKIAGAVPKAARAGAIIPFSTSRSMIVEAEWNQFYLTPEPTARYPFQNPVLLSTHRARLMTGSESSLIYGLSYRSVLRPVRSGPEQIEFTNRSLFGFGAGVRRTLKTFELELLIGAHFGERLTEVDASLRATTPIIPFETWNIVAGLQLEGDFQIHPEIQANASQVLRTLVTLGIVFGD